MKLLKSEKKEKIKDVFGDIRRGSSFLRWFDSFCDGFLNALDQIFLARLSRKLSGYAEESIFFKWISLLIRLLKALCTRVGILWHRYKLGSYFILYFHRLTKKKEKSEGDWILTIAIAACIMVLYLISSQQIQMIEILLLLSIIGTGFGILATEKGAKTLWKESFFWSFLQVIFFLNEEEM